MRVDMGCIRPTRGRVIRIEIEMDFKI